MANIKKAEQNLWRYVYAHWGYFAVVFVYFVVVIAVASWDPVAIQRLRFLAFDEYQQFFPRDYDPNTPVRIVDIDDASLKIVGQWPWSRTVMAQLNDRLAAAGAAVVAYDIMFSEPDRMSFEQIAPSLPDEAREDLTARLQDWPTNDARFAASIARAHVVLGITLSGDGPNRSIPAKAGYATAGDDPKPFLWGYPTVVDSLAPFNQAAAGLGADNWIPSVDGVVRRIPLMFRLNDQIVPALAPEALRVAQGASTYVLKASNASGETSFGNPSGLNHIRIGQFEVPTDADGAIWLHFRESNPRAFIPAWKVLQGKVSPDEINGRIILVGTSAAGLKDLRATPLDADIPGVEVHAADAGAHFSGEFLTRPDYAGALEMLLLLAVGIALAFFLPRGARNGPPSRAAGSCCSSWSADCCVSRRGPAVRSVYPSPRSFFCLRRRRVFHFRMAEHQRAEVQRMFGQYVAPAVVEASPRIRNSWCWAAKCAS